MEAEHAAPMPVAMYPVVTPGCQPGDHHHVLADQYLFCVATREETSVLAYMLGTLGFDVYHDVVEPWETPIQMPGPAPWETAA